MFDGTTKRVEQIQIDDELIGDDSSPKRVNCVAVRHNQRMFDVVPSSSEMRAATQRYTVTGDRVLRFVREGGPAAVGRGDRTVDAFLQLPATEQRAAKRVKRSLVFFMSMIRLDLEDLIDAYRLGHAHHDPRDMPDWIRAGAIHTRAHFLAGHLDKAATYNDASGSIVLPYDMSIEHLANTLGIVVVRDAELMRMRGRSLSRIPTILEIAAERCEPDDRTFGVTVAASEGRHPAYVVRVDGEDQRLLLADCTVA